jgi:hypothetical protein
MVYGRLEERSYKLPLDSRIDEHGHVLLARMAKLCRLSKYIIGHRASIALAQLFHVVNLLAVGLNKDHMSPVDKFLSCEIPERPI